MIVVGQETNNGIRPTTAKGFILLKPFAVLSEPDWIRTNDLLLRRQLLYPAELPVHLL